MVSDARLQRLKLISDLLIAWIGVLALLAGGAFALDEYLNQQQAERVRATLRYLDRFEALEGLHRLNRVWLRHDTEQQIALADPRPEAFYELVLRVIDENNLSPDLHEVIDWFDGLSICVERSVCDAALSQELFKPAGCAIYNRHFAYVQRERKAWDERFAMRLQKFCRPPGAARSGSINGAPSSEARG